MKEYMFVTFILNMPESGLFGRSVVYTNITYTLKCQFLLRITISRKFLNMKCKNITLKITRNTNYFLNANH